MALLTGEEFDVSGHGTTLDYASPTANAMLRWMWDDQVMQAIMRFGRDEEGAVVFAHTAALRDDHPVVGHGDVATAWTDNQQAVAAAAADRAGSTFTVADVAADSRVDCHRRMVRRLLNEFADLGYMHREQGTPTNTSSSRSPVPARSPSRMLRPQDHRPVASAHRSPDRPT